MGNTDSSTSNKDSPVPTKCSDSTIIGLELISLDLQHQPKSQHIKIDATKKAINLVKEISDLYDVDCSYCKQHYFVKVVDRSSAVPRGPQINLSQTIQENGLKSGDTVFFRRDVRGAGASYMEHWNCFMMIYKTHKEVTDDGTVFYHPRKGDAPIAARSYHVSCRSDTIPQALTSVVNMIGIVLYKYDGKQDWYLNGVHCRTGYVIIKHVDSLLEVQTIRGTMHSKLYKLIFGEDLDDTETLKKEIVGAGFAIKKGRLVFNSYTFNANGKDPYHNELKAMHTYEAIGIHSILQKWRNTNVQTWTVEQLNHASYFKEFCAVHLIWSFLKSPIEDIDQFADAGYLRKDAYQL